MDVFENDYSNSEANKALNLNMKKEREIAFVAVGVNNIASQD